MQNFSSLLNIIFLKVVIISEESAFCPLIHCKCRQLVPLKHLWHW